ncbi:MAG: hypothetical protein ACOZAO_00160 [Patescibacteria group bacterium]
MKYFIGQQSFEVSTDAAFVDCFSREKGWPSITVTFNPEQKKHFTATKGDDGWVDVVSNKPITSEYALKEAIAYGAKVGAEDIELLR